jgi:hypothetical protein
MLAGQEARTRARAVCGADDFVCDDTISGFFHRSCGKVCGKAALESYKFLKILYF